MTTRSPIGRPRKPRPLTVFERAAFRWLLTRGNPGRFASVSHQIGVTPSRLHRALLVPDRGRDSSVPLTEAQARRLRHLLTSEHHPPLDGTHSEIIPFAIDGHEVFDHGSVSMTMPFLVSPRAKPATPDFIHVGLDGVKLCGSFGADLRGRGGPHSVIPTRGKRTLTMHDGSERVVRFVAKHIDPLPDEAAYAWTVRVYLGRHDWRRDDDPASEENPVLASLSWGPRYATMPPVVAEMHGTAFALGIENQIADLLIVPLHLRDLEVIRLDVAVDACIDSRALLPVYRGPNAVKTISDRHRNPDRAGLRLGRAERQLAVYEKRGQALARRDPSSPASEPPAEARRRWVPIPWWAKTWPVITRIELRLDVEKPTQRESAGRRPTSSRTPATAIRQIAGWARGWRLADLRRLDRIDLKTLLVAEAALHGFSLHAPSAALVRHAKAVLDASRGRGQRDHIEALKAWRRLFGADHPLVASLPRALRRDYAGFVGRGSKDERVPPAEAERHFSIRILADLLNGARVRRPQPAIAAGRVLHTAVQDRLLALSRPPILDIAQQVVRSHRELWMSVRRLASPGRTASPHR